jgi:hypothetical protein
MRLLTISVAGAVAVVFIVSGCAVFRPYESDTPNLHICSVKREDKLLAIDGQSRLISSSGINSQGTRNTGKFTGLGGLDKWRYAARFLPADLQGEEYVVVFSAKGPDKIFNDPVTVKFEYMYPAGLEVHYAERVYQQLPRGRHKYVWKNIGTQNVQHGDIVGWRISLNWRGKEVDSMHSALWHPGGKVVFDE